MSEETNIIKRQIENFITSLSFLWVDDPLDGDATEDISKEVLRQLDEINGNTTTGCFCDACKEVKENE